MTAKQIEKSLTKAGIVASGKVKMNFGRDELEIWVEGEDERAIERPTTAIRNKALKALGWSEWNGYKAGYGSWVCRPGKGVQDFPGLASRRHY